MKYGDVSLSIQDILEKEFKMVEKLDNTSKNDSKGGDRE